MFRPVTVIAVLLLCRSAIVLRDRRVCYVRVRVHACVRQLHVAPVVALVGSLGKTDSASTSIRHCPYLPLGGRWSTHTTPHLSSRRKKRWLFYIRHTGCVYSYNFKGFRNIDVSPISQWFLQMTALFTLFKFKQTPHPVHLLSCRLACGILCPLFGHLHCSTYLLFWLKFS